MTAMIPTVTANAPREAKSAPVRGIHWIDVTRLRCYSPATMRSPSDNPALSADHAEHAARIAAMLRRWAEEDVSDEPAWEPGTIERSDFDAGSPSVSSTSIKSTDS